MVIPIQYSFTKKVSFLIAFPKFVDETCPRVRTQTEAERGNREEVNQGHNCETGARPQSI